MPDIGRAADLFAFRQQLEILLASRDFATSRLQCDFLRYISECTFEDRTQLDQEEIAAHVLGKSDDFVAAYDSSVRKLASMSRQRLARYYEGEGVRDRVLVTLPLRSYLPVYQIRETFPTASVAVPPVASWQLRRWHWVLAALALGAIVTAGVSRMSQRKLLIRAGVHTIETKRGDIAARGVDVPAPNILLSGRGLEDGQELTARLSFRPDFEAQQAGIVLWLDGDNFVRLGRRFAGRNHLEFGVEQGGLNPSPPENVVYDPEGQTGRPVWLSIRRAASSVAGFVSHDGLVWKRLGLPIDVGPTLAGAKAGIYAFHGRREAPGTRAEFRGVAIADVLRQESPITRVNSNCPVETRVTEEALALFLKIVSRRPRCAATLASVGLSGDAWSVQTRIDAANNPGAMAGLILQGSLGRLRLLRYDMNGPAISLMIDARMMYAKPDFHGSPPLTLRFERRGAFIEASYSRDEEIFEAFDQRIAANELGRDLRAALMLATSEKSEAAFDPAMSVMYLRRELVDLRPYR